MENPILNLDDLTVETFDPSAAGEQALIGTDGDCTGCDSGCGIIWP